MHTETLEERVPAEGRPPPVPDTPQEALTEDTQAGQPAEVPVPEEKAVGKSKMTCFQVCRIGDVQFLQKMFVSKLWNRKYLIYSYLLLLFFFFFYFLSHMESSQNYEVRVSMWRMVENES